MWTYMWTYFTTILACGLTLQQPPFSESTSFLLTEVGKMENGEKW